MSTGELFVTPNLMFDLGGVIMDIDRDRCVRAFERLGMTDADAFFDAYRQRGPFLQLEAGQLQPGEFRREIRRYISQPVSDEQIDSALCEFLIGIPPHRLQTLIDLRARGHKLWLLSNTNPIMWHRFILPEFTRAGLDINACFHGVLTSFEAGVCKPDAAIYRMALERFGIKGADTTFYDDGPANVEAARALGINAVVVNGI